MQHGMDLMTQRLYVRSVNDKTGGRGQLSSPRALPGVPAPSRMSVPRLLHNGMAIGEDHDLYCWTKSRPLQGKATPCPRKTLSRTAFSGRFANNRMFVDLDRFDYDLFWMSMNGESCRCGRDAVCRFRRLHLPHFHTLRQGAGTFGRLCAPGCGSVWPDWVLSESRKKGCVSPERRDSPLRLL